MCKKSNGKIYCTLNASDFVNVFMWLVQCGVYTNLSIPAFRFILRLNTITKDWLEPIKMYLFAVISLSSLVMHFLIQRVFNKELHLNPIRPISSSIKLERELGVA